MLRFFLFHSHRPFAVLTCLEAPTKKAFGSALLRDLCTFSALSALKLFLSSLRPEGETVRQGPVFRVY